MHNTAKLKFKEFAGEYGKLTPIEGGQDVPFEAKRIYYITGVEPGVRRGFHSHSKLHQVLLCLNGSVSILVKNPQEEKTVVLDDPTEGLYIGPMVWREMYDFSPGAVLLVLASEHYDAADYIRDYEVYETQARQRWK